MVCLRAGCCRRRIGGLDDRGRGDRRHELGLALLFQVVGEPLPGLWIRLDEKGDDDVVNADPANRRVTRGGLQNLAGVRKPDKRSFFFPFVGLRVKHDPLPRGERGEGNRKGGTEVVGHRPATQGRTAEGDTPRGREPTATTPCGRLGRSPDRLTHGQIRTLARIGINKCV